MVLLRLLQATRPRLSPILGRYYSTITEELTVQTFCDISIKVPYNVQIKPLDVHKYHNCDKLLITLSGSDLGRNTIKHIQDGNKIEIFSPVELCEEDVTCHIKAPIKANLKVVSHGNITTGFANGSKLFLTSTKGNIFVGKFQGEEMNLETNNGDIHLNGAIVANDIKVAVVGEGSIKAKRLQGNSCEVSTTKGNVSVDSCYCNDVTFDISNGEADLQNIHKQSFITVNNGNLSLRGLDGETQILVRNGNADIQLSQISEDSEAVLEGGAGLLTLQLSETCQRQTGFEIDAENATFDESLLSKITKDDGGFLLTPPDDKHVTRFKVLCKDGASVIVKHVTWEDAVRLHINK